MRKIKNKKAQGWGMDLIIAVTIFTIGLVAFFVYSLNSPGEAKEKIESLSYEGRILASTILSEGSPEGWGATNVIKIGILNNNKINETKIKIFYELTKIEENYEKTKELFDITYDYYFYLNKKIDINGDGSLMLEGIGKPGFDKEDIGTDIKNLIKITRYTVYQNKPMTAYFYIWEEE
jgi:hypothetical protein